MGRVRCQDVTARHGRRKLGLRGQQHFVLEASAPGQQPRWRRVLPGERLPEDAVVRSYDRSVRGMFKAYAELGSEVPDLFEGFPPIDTLWLYRSGVRMLASALPVAGAAVLRRGHGPYPDVDPADYASGPVDLTGFVTENPELDARLKERPPERRDRYAVGRPGELKTLEDGTVLTAAVGRVRGLKPGQNLVGGAARAELRKALGLPPTVVRDLDVVLSTGATPEQQAEYRATLAARGLGVDLSVRAVTWLWDEHGVSAAIRRDLDERDITLNEVTVFTDPNDPERTLVACSPEAVRDHREGVISPSRSAYDPSGDPPLSSRVAARSLRFAADMFADGLPVTLDLGLEDQVPVEDFDLALQLDRAATKGSAYEYLALVKRYVQDPPDADTPAALAEALGERLEGTYHFSPEAYDALPHLTEQIDFSRHRGRRDKERGEMLEEQWDAVQDEWDNGRPGRPRRPMRATQASSET